MPEDVLWKFMLCEVLHRTSPWRRSCVQSSWPGNPACISMSTVARWTPQSAPQLGIFEVLDVKEFAGRWIIHSCSDSCNEIGGTTTDVVELRPSVYRDITLLFGKRTSFDSKAKLSCFLIFGCPSAWITGKLQQFEMPEISFTGLRDLSQQNCVDLLVLFAKAGFGRMGWFSKAE